MSHSQKNEEIVRKFLASKAIDLNALGKFISENGESIATSENGAFGIVIRRPFVIHYCIPPEPYLQAVDLVEAGVRTAVTGK